MERGWRCGAGLIALSALMTWGPHRAGAVAPGARRMTSEPSADARHEFQLGGRLLQDPDGARYEEASPPIPARLHAQPFVEDPRQPGPERVQARAVRRRHRRYERTSKLPA